MDSFGFIWYLHGIVGESVCRMLEWIWGYLRIRHPGTPDQINGVRKVFNHWIYCRCTGLYLVFRRTNFMLTLRQSNMAIENPLYMEVLWEHHLISISINEGFSVAMFDYWRVILDKYWQIMSISMRCRSKTSDCMVWKNGMAFISGDKHQGHGYTIDTSITSPQHFEHFEPRYAKNCIKNIDNYFKIIHANIISIGVLRTNKTVA